MPELQYSDYYLPRMAHLKVEATYACDRGCPNCNRFTKLAPSDGLDDLDPSKLDDMLCKSARIGKIWTRITLTGGEPTMHHAFEEIVRVMMRYKNRHNPQCHATTFTYHHPVHYEKIERMLRKYPDLEVKDTNKSVPERHVFAVCMAPVDDSKYGPDHIYRGCHLGCRLCGLGFDNSGFYCCSIAAGIARVFGMQIAIPSIYGVSMDALIDQFRHVCPKCGFYNLCRAKDKGREWISPTWRRAFRDFNRRRAAARGTSQTRCARTPSPRSPTTSRHACGCAPACVDSRSTP